MSASGSGTRGSAGLVTRAAWAAMIVVALAAGLALVRWHASLAPTGSASGVPVEDADVPRADWCAPGYSPIEGGGCFARAARSASAPLIVYLHGRYTSDAGAPEVDRQRRLATRATERGFSVLALRGRLGVCTAAELADWYCWPSNERNSGEASAFVDDWKPVLAAAAQRSGSSRRFVLGFSNGGYFAGLLAERGLLDAEGFVVAHGGPVDPVHAVREQPPLLLLSADDDVAQDDMIRFDEELTRERWAHDAYARAGGHDLTNEDIDAALAFFTRAKEKLPLNPPLHLHRALRRQGDSEEPAPSASPDNANPYDENAHDENPGDAYEADCCPMSSD